jgi:hypothetical protein
MYLGDASGHIFTYDTDNDTYKDNPGGVETDYTQILKTAIFDPFPRNLCIFKKPSFNYQVILDGTGTINFYKDYGTNLVHDDFAEVNFTFPSEYQTMSDYEDETLADHEEEYLWNSDMATTAIPYKSPHVNTVQTELVINTGAIELKDISVDIAMGRKK